MQAVSSTFSGWVNGHYNTPQPGVLISWDKSTSDSVEYFTIGSSVIGGPDIIKSAGGTPVFSDQYSYKDYTKYATGWTISKSLGQYPYGVIQSQATITLNNASNLFTAASGTALGPNIVTGRPVKLSIGFGGESIYQFTGYSDTPQFTASNRTVELHCFDAIDYLNSFISTLNTILNTTADNIIAALLQEAGFSTSQYVLEPSLQPAIVAFAPQGQSVASLIQTLCEAEGALFFCDEQGILRFWNREHFANSTTPVFTFNYSNITDYVDEDTPILNYISVESSPFVVSADEQIYSTTTPVIIGGTGANLNNNITNPSFEVSTSGWSGDMVRTPNASNVGSYSASGTNMTYDLSAVVVTSPDGLGYKATAQMEVKASSGVTVSGILNGSAVAGQSIVGSPQVGIAGNGNWQKITVSGQHYNIAAQGSINGWTQTTNMPFPYDLFNAVTFSGRVYVVTFNIDYASLNQPSIGAFAYAQHLPTQQHAHSPVVYNSRIYTIGGSDNSGNTLSDVYASKINPNGTVGTPTAVSSLTTPRTYQSSVTYSGYLYAFGGQGTTGVLSSTEYVKANADGTLGTWATTTSLPKKLWIFAPIVINSIVYIIGGFNSTDGIYSSVVYYATINSNGTLNSWNTTTSLPVALAFVNAVYNNGYIYVLGGQTSDGKASKAVYYAKINSDGTLGSWSTGTSMPETKEGFAAFTDSSYIYVAGGYTGFADSANIYYTSQAATGVTLTVSGNKPFYLDAVSTETNSNYFDGDTTSTSLTTYRWNGTQGLSTSTAASVPPTYTFRISPSSPVVSIDTPVANAGTGSAYTANTKSDGTGTDMSSFIIPFSIQAGNQVLVSFANTSSQQAYITSLTLYGTVATNSGTVSQSFIDNNSIFDFKLNPANGGQILTISNDYIQTNGTAYGLAYYLGNNYSSPHRQITTTNFVAPQLQFGDMVAFINKETGETRNLFVMGKTDTLQIQNDQPVFTQQLLLQERSNVKYFTIGTSTIGGTDSLAP